VSISPLTTAAPGPVPAVAMLEGLTREYLFHHQICPARFTPDGHLVVKAVGDVPPDVLDDLVLLYGASVVVEPAPRAEVDRLTEHLARDAERSLMVSLEQTDDGLDADVRDLAVQPPVIRYVNFLIADAHEAGASDIHVEAVRAGAVVRYRLDGMLSNGPEPPAGLHQAVVSRIKLLAQLDVAERRRPQDGRIRIRLHERELELRVSSVPTMVGESVVLRLLEQGGRPVSLVELGMSEDYLTTLLDILRRPQGLILVTGPTGSGKTTTLYAALQARALGREKVVTVEDPIEYQLPGVTQVPVHRQIGVTFGAMLRHILRQDPDVVMIGEMRDEETAQLAVQAALTGHLVLATLHTNDAVGALPRLLDLGVPAYLIAATLSAIVSQRLVRRLCTQCRRHGSSSSPGSAADGWGQGDGCAQCRHTGYRGRTGIFEMIQVTDTLRAMIARGAPLEEMETQARSDGSRTLQSDGLEKVRRGETTTEELTRVIGAM
jgi:type II secretory ATPase GspE/PulE/Tfp pilus assembly ATPase PilB-like protein